MSGLSLGRTRALAEALASDCPMPRSGGGERIDDESFVKPKH